MMCQSLLHTMRAAVAILLAFLFFIGLTEETEAASLSVSPLTVTIPPDGAPRVVRVQNQGENAVLVHVSAVEWADPDQIDYAETADEILVVPPVFRLERGSTQVLRLALRRPVDDAREHHYRLLITEVPVAVTPITGVTFAIRLNVPLFVTPNGAAPDPIWSIRETPDGNAELVLRNEGQAHLRVHNVALQELDGSPVLTIDQEATALPGKERSWPLARPAQALPQMLQVRAETQRGELVMPLTHIRE